jgi:hypothetical protein
MKDYIYDGRIFKTWDSILSYLRRKYGNDTKLEYVANFFDLTKDIIEKEYYSNNLSLKDFKNKYGISIISIKDLFKFYKIKEKIEPVLTKGEKIKNTLLKKYGVTSTSKIPGVYEKIYGEKAQSNRTAGIRKFHQDNPSFMKDHNNKIKNIMNERYGVDNPFQLPDVKLKCNTNESIEKARKTRYENGTSAYITKEQLECYHFYKLQVRRLTKESYRLFKKAINPYNLKRAKGSNNEDYQLDHKFSIKDGFINKINPEIISSPINLRMVKSIENNKKAGKSSITIEELLDLYQEFENSRDFILKDLQKMN